jgi:hypothetical protein
MTRSFADQKRELSYPRQSARSALSAFHCFFWELAVQHTQLLVYESDGRLGALLRPLAESNAWFLRQPRQTEACLRLLERGGPAVLVVRAGRDLEQELTLIDLVRFSHPDVHVVLVGGPEHARLAGLAWDLGASWVCLFPQPTDDLLSVIAGLLGARHPEGVP